MTKKKIDMKTLEEEAEEYSDYKNDYVPMSFGDKFNPTTKRDFIAGANSKWVQAEKIKAQIDVLKNVVSKIGHYDILRKDIEDLQQQLKQLEDESR